MLRFEGSSTLSSVVTQLSEAYQHQQPNMAILHEETSSGKGFKTLLAGDCDIARMSRMLESHELDAASQLGVPVRSFCLGYDAIVIIVHPSRANDLPHLTSEDIHAIWFGEESLHWNALGTKDDRAVEVYCGSKDGGTTKVFRDRIAGGRKLSEHVTAMAESLDILTQISSNPNAIGFVSLKHVTADVSVVPFLTSEEQLIAPRSMSGLGTGYPLIRSLQLVCTSPIKPKVARFIDFALRVEGQLIIAEAGFIPIRYW